jgi:hypothetical protein
VAPLVITQAELLEALASAVKGTAPEDAKTVQQLAAETNMAVWQVQKALRALHAQKRLQCYRVPFVGIDGRHGKVPAYTILPVS